MNPIQLSLFSSRINAICEEMGEILRLSSFSPNIKDRLDFSCAIFDANGELCAQAAHIPVHLGSMAYAMKDVVKDVDWQDGDMLVFNDPFKGGTHLPDVTIVAPVFFQEKLCAFISNRAHHADIGAKTAGSMPLTTKLEEEGLLITASKIVKKYQLDEEVFSHILNHMSCPTTSKGDFFAQISANKTALTRLNSLISSLGLKQFKTALIALNNYAERISQQIFLTIPDGEYFFSDYLEDDGFSEKPLKIQLKLLVKHDKVVLDFSGSAKQTQGNLNCPFAVTAAAVYYVFRCLMPANTPACSGTFRQIYITTDPNSLINAQYPAAVAAGNVETSSRIVDVILGALSQAIADKIPAASYGGMNNVAMGNNDSRQQQAWNYYETIAGGHGASAIADGLSAQQAHMTNTLNTPIESLETHYPLRLVHYGLHNNNTGIGEHNGGDGIIRCFEFLQDSQVTLLTERRKLSPWGLNGAGDGIHGENLLDDQVLPSKIQLYVKQGQRLTIKTPGGGGWVPPPTLS